MGGMGRFLHIVGIARVGHVQVIGLGGEFGGEGIDLLDYGQDAVVLSHLADLRGSLVRVGEIEIPSDLLVAESRPLQTEQTILSIARNQLLHAAAPLAGVPHPRDIVQLAQEPPVDLGQFVYLVHCPSILQRLLDREQSGIGRSLQLRLERNLILIEHQFGIYTLQSVECRIDHTARLLHHLLEGTSDRHDLADRKHRRSELVGDVLKFLEIPSGHLEDAVVQRGFEARSGRLGDAILDADEILAQAQFGGDVREGVASSLGRQGGRTGQTGIHLNDAILLTLGMQSVLNVALPHNAQVTHHLDGRLSEHEIFPIRESLGGRHHDGISRVDTQRVEILHVAHRDAIVGGITDYLVLQFLPSPQILIDENLTGGSKRLGGQFAEFLLVVGESRSQSSKGKGGTYQHGKTNFVGNHDGLVDGSGGITEGDGLVNLLQFFRKYFAIFRGFNDGNLCTEHLHPGSLKLSRLPQFHPNIQGSLSSHGDNDTVRLLLVYDIHDYRRTDGEEVHRIGPLAVISLFLRGLDCRNVGIDQNHLDPLLFQSLDALTSRIVEFARLTDAESTGTNQEDLLVGTLLVP
mmetsp:Transcript_59704/g.176908  ORF Transcript_59704/g.176908 Transcript_59704/m.176908 type:complete len:576 (+) Transcript_59704:1946-3673(+)